jgi:hypothetical protein
VAVFLGFSCSQVQYLLSHPADQHRVRCLLGNDARWRSWGRGVVWVVRTSISGVRRGAGRREGSLSSLAEVVGVHPLHLVGALQRYAHAVVDHEVGERIPVDQDHLVRYPAYYPCSTLLSSRSLSNFACSFSACSSLPYLLCSDTSSGHAASASSGVGYWRKCTSTRYPRRRASVEAMVHNEAMGKVLIAIIVIAVIAVAVWFVLSRRRG